MLQNSRYIRRYKVLALAETNYKRAFFSDSYKRIRVVGTKHSQCIRTVNLAYNLNHSVDYIAVIVILKQMRYNLGIGFRNKLKTLFCKILAKLQIVLNNSVMYDRKSA